MEVSLTELDEAPDQAFFQRRVLPFDLLSDRLCRLEVYTCKGDAWLFMDIHHTVFDGLSRNVFIGDIRRALSGEPLRAETLTAYDFALYEKELREGEDYAEARKYFDALLEGAETAALASSRTPDGTPTGALELRMPRSGIDRFCRRCGVTQGSFFRRPLRNASDE